MVMRRVLVFLAAAALALGLNACTGSPAAPGGCCAKGSGGSKAEGKPMTCEMKAACSCCAKGDVGASSQDHQH
jgi:hypothetical protein